MMEIFMSLEQNLPSVLDEFTSSFTDPPVRGKRFSPTTSGVPEKRRALDFDEMFFNYEYNTDTDTYNPFLNDKYISDIAIDGMQHEDSTVQSEEDCPVILELQNSGSSESYERLYWTDDTQQMVPHSPVLPADQTEVYCMKPNKFDHLVIKNDTAIESTPTSPPSSSFKTTFSPTIFESNEIEESDSNLSATSLRGKQVNYEMVPGVRNGCKMLYSLDEDQIYKVNKTNADGTVSFTCKEPKCAERVTLHPNGNCFYSQSKSGHAHDKKKEYQERINRLVEVKTKCAEIDNFAFGTKVVAVRNIFYSVFEHSVENDALFEKVKRTLLKDMSTALCKSPKTCEKITAAFESQSVREKYGLTIRKPEKGESQPKRTMFYKATIESDAHSFCLFASDDIVEAINEKLEPSSRTFLSNTTFAIQSFGMFKHLLIIYIDFMGQPIPFIYVLMTTKTEQCYSAIFQYIEKNIISLNGKSFMADYERSMRHALKNLFPDLKIAACWYHFSQNLKQNALRFREMMKEIRNNSAAKEIYHKLHVIPLLPPKLIQSTFQSLKSTARTIHPSKFTKFLKYYERQWLHTETSQSISMLGLTTQVARGMDDHKRALGKQIPKKGNFFRFVHALLLQEQNKEKEVRTLSGNGKVSANRQEKLNENRCEMIKKMRQAILNAELDISEFLSYVLKYETQPKENLLDFENLADLMDEDDDESDGCESHLCKVCEQFEDCLNDLVDKLS